MVFQVFVWFSVVLALAYAGLMLLYLTGWRRLKQHALPAGFQPQTKISVIVPARNEAKNIGACIRSVLGNHYPETLLEIIVVDDHSDDDTAAIVLELSAGKHRPIRLLRLADHLTPGAQVVSYKKKAIETAVAHAHGELIAATDADCTVPPDWLWLLASAYEQHRPAAIAAPVLIHRDNSLLQHYVALDTAGMMLITGAGIQLGLHRMGNGANLAYTKRAFLEVNGFAGNTHRASGDDMFLLQKIAARYPKAVLFLKNSAAVVHTEAPATYTDFFRQRLRWGGKTTALPEWQTKAVLALVFGFSCCILLGFGWLVFNFQMRTLGLFVLLVALKALPDYLLLRKACGFFAQTELMRYFWPAFALHTFFIPITGLAGLLVKNFEWKGRKVR